MLSRLIIFTVAFALCFGSLAVQAETKVVTSHPNVTITCDPSGENHFARWAVFPDKKVPVRRVFMELTLGYPDSLNIAHWDYLDHITIRRVGGIKGDTLNLELGRMLTPYGSNFKPCWKWKWRVDVTDFASLLRDSVEIDYMHSGYESKEVGWSLNIDFQLQLGTPAAELVSYQNLYTGNYAYGDTLNPISKSLAPIDVNMSPKAEFGRLRIQHTGHGMDRPRGCSEFCSRWREVYLDGTVIDRRNMWKECADNALYPQGGTWIFDRAYWCPGDLQPADLIDFKVTKPQHEIDIEMESYTAEGKASANEAINAILFQYKTPAKEFDVAIDEIKVPNNDPSYNRLNPSCFEPRVVIRNMGSEPLQAVEIVYGTEGFPFKTFSWTGSLNFYESTEVVLPGNIDFQPGKNTFSVQVNLPEKHNDGWEGDNFLQSQFDAPKELPEKMLLVYKTNNAPKDNTIAILNGDGKLVYERTPDSSEANTIYTDTLKLPEGRYRMALRDTANNGLEFWFMPDQGYGYLYLSDLSGRKLHRFESDCGLGETLDFTTSLSARIDSSVEQEMFILHPRMFKDKTELFVDLDGPSDGEIHILADGKLVRSVPFTQVKKRTFELDFSDFEDGRYVVELFVNKESKMKLRVNKTQRQYN
ncbi:peptide-N-glycosidase F-related protein [Mangrovibacterium diazotrophicum]|uniref:Peptide-N-glycosidase F-like protein n=1 Tax=Mangrovibacterium diazotrophicum TaxID=1261403 RepID=A0A419WBU7_9BACT|nr:peptide-N-glycosidase F-related protein [Mangrovibacterium diazotrophicum]RKD92892.1 peptide-N-glycosidase F-like protein [Mangrovibacterium diazotrophicum]